MRSPATRCTSRPFIRYRTPEVRSSSHHPGALALLGAMLLLPACTRRFDPQATPSVGAPDERTSSAFNEARALFEKGELERADRAFAELASQRATEPTIVQITALYRGRIALRLNQPKRAYAILSALANRPLTDQVKQSNNYYLGLACVRTARYACGRKLLTPPLDQLDKDAQPAALAALARAEEKLEAPTRAVRLFERLYGLTDRASERAFATTSIRRILAHGQRDEDLAALQRSADSGGILFALVVQRRVTLAQQQGNVSQVRALSKLATESAQAHHLAPVSVLGDIAAARPALGVLLPTRGKYRAVAELAIDGITSAAGTLRSSGAYPPLEVFLRDSSDNAAQTAEALIKEAGVVALLGLFSPAAVRDVARVAERYGVPLLCLAPNASGQTESSLVLQLMPDNGARARRLASATLKELRGTPGAPSAAILAPDSSFGRSMTNAFSAAWREGGGRLTKTVTYAPRDRVFAKAAEKLSRLDFDVLFVPESASRLGLVAAALARAGLWSAARAGTSGTNRTVRLLATADGLSTRLLQSARRYLQGALLAPGYYHDANPELQPLLDSTGRGSDWRPGLIAAVAFDGAYLVRGFLAQNQPSSSALTRAARGPTITGLTGRVHFGDDGLRADPPLLYTITGDQITRVTP